MIEAFQTVLMRLALCGLAGSLVLLALRSRIARDTFARLLFIWRPLAAFGRVAVCSFLLIGVLVGGDKTNNVPPNMNQPLPQMQHGGASFQTGFTGLTGLSGSLPCTPTSLNPVNPVNPVQNNIPVQTTIEDVVRGWRVESVTTNAAVSYAMPSNAVLVGNWHKRGTFGEWMRIELCDFAFPLGTNATVYSSFSAFNDGKIRPVPRDVAHEICAVGVPMLAMQDESRFWVADGEEDSKILTWENFFLDGDTNTSINAQIALYPRGDFLTRSNEVETVCRRVNPDDWDDDGIPNDEDTNPTVCDGDFFGPSNILPVGANTNAYCAISVVVTGPDALVTFAGDRPCNYPDPRFVAKSGVTNEVVILIGKTYAISSDSPFAVVGVSDPDTEVWQMRGAANQTYVRRPATISTSGGNPFTMDVTPPNLGGLFSWQQSACGCQVYDFGLSYAMISTNGCSCGGCSPYGLYWYEGYNLSAWGGTCDCSVSGVSIEPVVTLDWPSVIDVMRSGETSVTANVSFSCATPTNGVLSLLWAANDCLFVGKGVGGLEEAEQVERIGVTNCTSLSIDYRLTGLRDSDHYEAGVVGVMWEDELGSRTLAMKNFTVVERNSKPITDEKTFETAPFAVVNPSCANSNDVVYLCVSVEPSQFPDEKIMWRCKTGSAAFPDGARGRLVKARMGTETTVFAVQVGDCPSPELELTVKVWPSE